MTGKSRKTLSAPSARNPATGEQRPPESDLIGAACNVMMRVRQLEHAGDDRDTAVESALEELCVHMGDVPGGVARRLLVAALLRMSIKASVGVQGLAYTTAVLIDMTDNLTGTGMTGSIN